jgi:hypothetical protein
MSETCRCDQSERLPAWYHPADLSENRPLMQPVPLQRLLDVHPLENL